MPMILYYFKVDVGMDLAPMCERMAMQLGGRPHRNWLAIKEAMELNAMHA